MNAVVANTVPQELHRAMLSAGFFPEKRFSQNFLMNEAVVKALVDAAELKKSDSVLEIGAGTGIITREILKHPIKEVHAIEVHDRLIPLLKKSFENDSRVRILGEDFLQTDLHAISFTKVVSSPPYAISDDIMYALFRKGFSIASLVWQLEFAEKLLAPPGSGEYHALSVLCQNAYNGTILQKISPQSFYPSPQQFSAILVLKRKKKVLEPSNYDSFVKFLKTIFRFRNKTISNVLNQAQRHFPIPKSAEKIQEVLRKMKIDDVKLFLLEPEEIVKLFNTLFEK